MGYITSVASCENVSDKNASELMKDNQFRRVLVRRVIGKKDSCHILVVRDVTDTLRKYVKICEEHDITHNPEFENALPRAVFPGMATKYNQIWYGEEKKEMTRSLGHGNGRIENIDGNTKSFEGFVQLIFDKRATSLKIRC